MSYSDRLLPENYIFNKAYDPDYDALRVNIASGSVTLNTGDIEIGAVEIKDSTTNNRMEVEADGSINVNVVLGGPDDNVALTNSTGTLINPATVESVNTVNTTLQGIRDTSGIKKIVDKVQVEGYVAVTGSLPSGTNNIGDVDVLTLPSVILSSQANPFTNKIQVDAQITGSVPISVTQGTSPWVVTGSVTINNSDIQIGAVELKDGSTDQRATIDSSGRLYVLADQGNNPWDVEGYVAITGSIPTGSNVIGAVTQSGVWNVNATQVGSPWDVEGYVSITGSLPAGTNNIGDVDVLTLPSVTLASQANPFTNNLQVDAQITGSITIPVSQSGTWNTNVTQVGSPWDVEGYVAITGSLPAGTNAIGKLSANDGVDIGDVTVNNGSGASAVNIQDGGNSITVDGTINAIQSGSPWDVEGYVAITGSIPTGSNVIGAVTQSGTWNVNATQVGSPWDVEGYVAITGSIPAGTNNIGDVDVLTLPNVTLATQSNPFTNKLQADVNVTGSIGTSVVNGAVPSLLYAIGGKDLSNETIHPIPLGDTGESVIIAWTGAPSVTVSYSTSTSGVPSAVSVANTATLIKATNSSRKKIMIFNNDTSKTVYLGQSGVTTSTGMPVPPQSVFIDEMPYVGVVAIYGIVSTGTADVRVQEWT